MNTPEELRVIDALRALSGGLVVTEQDIIEAHGKLQRQIQQPGPRGRWLVLAAAAMIIVAGIVTFQAIVGRDESAPPPVDQPQVPQAAAIAALEAAMDPQVYGLPEDEFLAGRPPTQEDLAGVWLLRTPYTFPMFFTANGRWASDIPTQMSGEYTLTGKSFFRRYDQSSGCGQQVGAEGQTWQAAVAPDGSLRLMFASGTNVCTPADDREVWDRLGPGRSPITDFLRDYTAALNWDSQQLGRVPQGLYLAPGSGHLLRVSAEGRYLFYDTLDGEALVQADHGVLTVDGGGGDPVTVSASCRGGSLIGTMQRSSTPEVPQIIDRMEALRIDATADSCASGLGTDGVWVRILT